jgi:membrane-associated protease RseP (regulator of RpoE activity)
VSLGFGKPILFSKKIGRTTYQITPWILGGYCKLEGEMEYSDNPHAFTNLSYRDKLIISCAGCYINIVIGMWGVIFALMFHNYFLYLLGYLGICLGVGNMIPFPALDGSYLWMFGLEKIYGKKKALNIIKQLCMYGMIVLMALNILCIPYLIQLIKSGAL